MKKKWLRYYETHNDEFQILNEWEKMWNKNAPIGNISTQNNLFFNVFLETYKSTYYKKVNNKNKNIIWKSLFVTALFAGFVFFLYTMYHFADTEKFSKQLISSGVILVFIMLACGAISKWLDIKKFQETWSRHSTHIHSLDREMLLYIYQMSPYDSFPREEIFVRRILDIEDMNQEKFSQNMETKETEMMDIFDRIKGK